MNLQNKYIPDGSQPNPASNSGERKEWYDYTFLNLIVKYVKKAQAEGKL